MKIRKILLWLIFCEVSLSAWAEPPFDVHNPGEGLFFEEWMSVYFGTLKIGYTHTSYVRRDNEVHTRATTFMRLGRGEVEITMGSDQRTVETVEGEAISFKFETQLGSMPLVQEGERVGDGIRVATAQAGNRQERRYKWKRGAVMAWGLTRETMLHGFSPGTRYTVSIYSPEVKPDGAIVLNVEVGRKESHSFLGGELQGRRMETRMDFGASSVDSLAWVDEVGRTLVGTISMGGIDLTVLRSEEATALTGLVPADIFESSLLSLEGAIPIDARRVDYVIRFKRSLQEAVSWPETAYQRILSSSLDEVRFRVYRARHEDLRQLEDENRGLPGSEFLGENATLNVGDPVLVRLARKASVPVGDNIELADRLRRFTTRYISRKSFEVGFATASEVARNPSGDCSEHAVLLAALGRIRGIPSRIAAGLAYIPRYGGRDNIMGFHMWTQFHLRGRWVDFDAALRESECAPTRIALAVGSFHNDTMADLALPITQLVGLVDIEVIDVEAPGR